MARPIRILLVEDNPGDADLIRETLAEVVPQLDVLVIGDGAEAVEYLNRRRHGSNDPEMRLPDLMLLDLNLPKMSGHEVLAEARKSPELRALPIVVVTSSDASRDIVASYRLGANAYVTKAGELTAFQSTVRALGHFWCSAARLPS
jgi:CheY-like chemotaxis protein